MQAGCGLVAEVTWSRDGKNVEGSERVKRGRGGTAVRTRK